MNKDVNMRAFKNPGHRVRRELRGLVWVRKVTRWRQRLSEKKKKNLSMNSFGEKKLNLIKLMIITIITRTNIGLHFLAHQCVHSFICCSFSKAYPALSLGQNNHGTQKEWGHSAGRLTEDLIVVAEVVI